MSTHSYCIVLPVCQTDNLQMSAPGLGGYGPKECPSNVQPAWERGAASWPSLPLGSGSPRALRGHTNWLLVMCSHTQTSTLAHMFMHYFYTFYMCAHMNTCIYCIHTKKTNPNKHLASWQPMESFFQSFLCNSGIVTMPTACHLPCCLKVTVTCSHCADIIHKQTYNKGRLSRCLSPCLTVSLLQFCFGNISKGMLGPDQSECFNLVIVRPDGLSTSAGWLACRATIHSLCFSADIPERQIRTLSW